jgi:uncharacterized damage-inducible protein DinB
MTMTVDVLRHHVNYTAWASSRLVDAAGSLSQEDLTKDFGTSDRSVIGTLAHIFAADRAWLGRIEGNPPTRFLDPEQDLDLNVLRSDWPALMERWKQWASRLTDEAILQNISYKSLKGDPFVTPVWQIVMHVVNHGTHHRGQVSGFLRTMGHTPPSVDLTVFYRETLR